MASFWSDYFKNKVLDHIRGVASYTPASMSHFALMKVAPTPAGGGTESTAPRLSANNSSAVWNAASAGATTNKVELHFIVSAPTDYGTIVGIAEYDSVTGGHLLTYGDLTAPKEILTGMSFSVLAGNGEFTFVDDTPPIG